MRSGAFAELVFKKKKKKKKVYAPLQLFYFKEQKVLSKLLLVDDTRMYILPGHLMFEFTFSILYLRLWYFQHYYCSGAGVRGRGSNQPTTS